VFLGFGLPSPPTRFSDNVYAIGAAMTAPPRFSLPRSGSILTEPNREPITDANFILMKTARGRQGVLAVFLDFRRYLKNKLTVGHCRGCALFAPSKAKMGPPTFPKTASLGDTGN